MSGKNITLARGLCLPLAALLVMLALACALPASQPLASAPLHGNVHSRIFHNASCRYYNCRNCTAVFASAAEARAAGFRACKVCGG